MLRVRQSKELEICPISVPREARRGHRVSRYSADVSCIHTLVGPLQNAPAKALLSIGS